MQPHRNRCAHFCAFRNEPVGEAAAAGEACEGCYSIDILEGELVSESGKCYPITKGIPRLLSEATTGFLQKNQKSFSLEWKYSRNGERNWGQDLEIRKQLFLNGIGAQPEELRGKLMLDAGCGSALLSRAIAESYGIEVVGVDLASGIETAYAQNAHAHAHFVQASVLELPLRAKMFDYIYCAGVLIHLPDTRAAFDLLPRFLKPGGRLFVWVYHPVDHHELASDRIRETLYQWIRRRITSRLPIQIQELLYLGLAGLFALRQAALTRMNRSHDDRSWREKMQNLVDTFSPSYVNRHTEEEVLGWFRDKGFTNCTVAYRERYGFGVRGDLNQYPQQSPETPSAIRVPALVNE